MSEESPYFYSGKEAQTNQQAAGQLASILGSAFEPNPYDNYSDMRRDSAIQAGTFAIQGAAAGAAFGPIGAGVGAVVGLASGLISGRKKRKAIKAQREAQRQLEIKRWKQALGEYRRNLKDAQGGVKQSKKQVSQQNSQIFSQAMAEATKYEEIVNNVAVGVEQIGRVDRGQQARFNAVHTAQREEGLNQLRLSKLQKLDALIEKERTSGRAFGQLRGRYADDIQELSNELKEV